MEDVALRGAPGPVGTVEDPIPGQPVDDTIGSDRWAGASDEPDPTRMAGVGVGFILAAAICAQRLAAGRPWWEVAVFVAYGVPVCSFLFMIVVAKVAGAPTHRLRRRSAKAPRRDVLTPAQPFLAQPPTITG